MITQPYWTVLLPNNIKTDHKMKMKNQYKKQLMPLNSSLSQGSHLASSVKISRINHLKAAKIGTLTVAQTRKVALVSQR